MSLYFLAFLAGILSILAPCVLPVLPVILGGSLGSTDNKRPRIIIVTSGICIILFTLLLKVSTLLIEVPPSTRERISGTIILLYGLTLIFPHARDYLSFKLGASKSQELLSTPRTGIRKDVILGAAIGPIFTSCSPTYALILSIIFPVSLVEGIIATTIYTLGFCAMLALIVLGGRKIIQKLTRLANPESGFKKWLGILLIITGIIIGTGYMKKIETAIVDSGYFDVTQLEQYLVDTQTK